MNARYLLAFDFDGTIADSVECIVQSMAATFQSEALPPPARRDVLRSIGIPLERSLPMLGAVGRDDAGIARMVASYRRFYAELAELHLKLFPGIAELLIDLDGLATLGIVTGKNSAVAAANCELLGVRRHFKTIVGSDTTSRHKPEPEPLWALMASHSVEDPRDVVVIGDSPLDILMGRSAGAQTIAVTWGAEPRERLLEAGPERIVDSVSELRDAVRAILAR